MFKAREDAEKRAYEAYQMQLTLAQVCLSHHRFLGSVIPSALLLCRMSSSVRKHSRSKKRNVLP
jgi:hypothetical protein